MGLSSGPEIINMNIPSIDSPLPPPPPTYSAGSGSGTPGDGSTGGNSNTGGIINPANPNDPDINSSNGDYMYPCDSTYITSLHTQYEFDGNMHSVELDTCVAHAYALALEILEYKKRGIQYKFSYGWIYGNRTGFQDTSIINNEGLSIADSLNATKNTGVCLYDTLPNAWFYKKANEYAYYSSHNISSAPAYVDDEYTQVHNIYDNTLTECSHFKFGSWSYFNATDTATLKGYIETYGCALIWVYNGQDMWNAETNDGIVVYNSANSTQGFSHVMCVRGWKLIAGKYYWICQNSWKTYWGGLMGHNGFFFIPFDYPRIIRLIAITPYYPTASLFNWSTSISVGSTASLLAEDWNKLGDRVITKLYNRSLYPSPPIKYVKKGQPFTASLFNEINSNISRMSSTGIGSKVKGNTVYASDLNLLVTKINSL